MVPHGNVTRSKRMVMQNKESSQVTSGESQTTSGDEESMAGLYVALGLGLTAIAGSVILCHSEKERQVLSHGYLYRSCISSLSYKCILCLSTESIYLSLNKRYIS